MIAAAITIGSNSTRMLTARCGCVLAPLVRGREETRLMMGLDENGFLTQDAMARTVAAVLRLQQQAAAAGAEQIALMATSATRDARNADDFARRLLTATGLEMTVLSGGEEAALAFRAVAGLSRRLVMDVGGGSTELTYGDRGVVLHASSAQVGASRLLKIQPIASLEDARQVYELALQGLEKDVARLHPLLRGGCEGLTGLGGACTTAAAMLMASDGRTGDTDGYRVTLAQAQALLHMLAPLSPEARKAVPGLPESRVLHMPHGLCILIAVMTLTGLDALTVSTRTNLDGYLMGLCS